VLIHDGNIWIYTYDEPESAWKYGPETRYLMGERSQKDLRLNKIHEKIDRFFGMKARLRVVLSGKIRFSQYSDFFAGESDNERFFKKKYAWNEYPAVALSSWKSPAEILIDHNNDLSGKDWTRPLIPNSSTFPMSFRNNNYRGETETLICSVSEKLPETDFEFQLLEQKSPSGNAPIFKYNDQFKPPVKSGSQPNAKK
jgi:hypothetical protein